MDFSLTEEQRAIQETAREFARREVDPIVDEIDESQKFPREVIRKAGELGFLGIIFPEEYGGAGLGYIEYVIVVTELSRVDPSVGISVAAHNSLCSNHIYKFGSEEQKQRWLVPLASGREDRRLEPHRAGRRLGRGRHPHPRRAGGRRVDPERRQDLHHPRQRRRHLRRLRGDRPQRHARPQHLGLRARQGDGGVPPRQEGEQARHPRLRHRRGGDGELLRLRGPAARQGGRGVQAGPADPRRRPHLDRGAGARHGDRRLRHGARLLQGARAVRQADLAVPGDPVRPGRDGDPHRGGAGR